MVFMFDCKFFGFIIKLLNEFKKLLQLAKKSTLKRVFLSDIFFRGKKAKQKIIFLQILIHEHTQKKNKIKILQNYIYILILKN